MAPTNDARHHNDGPFENIMLERLDVEFRQPRAWRKLPIRKFSTKVVILAAVILALLAGILTGFGIWLSQHGTA